MLSEEEILKIRTEVLEKLKLPQIWQRMIISKDGRETEVHIRELQEKRYRKALLFLREHYLTQDHLCEMLKISSCPRSSSGLLNLVLTWMKDGISLEAVVEGETETSSGSFQSATTKSEDNEEEIVGLLVCRVSHRLEHSRTFSRFRISNLEMDPAAQNTEGESTSTESEKTTESNVQQENRQDISKLHQYIKLRGHMAKLIDLYEHYDIDKLLQIYIVNVHSEWLTTVLSEYLMRAALQQATQLDIRVVMRIITSKNEQINTRKIGMTVLASISYSEWEGGNSSNETENIDLIQLMAIKIKKKKLAIATSPQV